MTAISEQSPVTLINVLSVDPADMDRLLELLKQNTETVIMGMQGWIATDLITALDRTRIVIHSKWETPSHVKAMREDPRMAAYFPKIAALARLESIPGHVAVSHSRQFAAPQVD